MALMNWSDSLSVGVKALDEQHKSLVQTLNDLHAAMMSGQSKTAAGPLLQKLVKYTHDHFVAEEAMMRRAQYPEFNKHCDVHRELTRQVEEFVGRYERGEISLSVHLMNFLRDWLTTHIQKEDKNYGPWLNTHGVH